MKNYKIWIKLSLLCGLFILSSFRVDIKFHIESDYLKITIDDKGSIKSLFDKSKEKEYFSNGQSSPILSLYKKSTYIHPEKAVYNKTAQTISLYYPSKNIAIVKIINKGRYLRLELLSLSSSKDIEAIVWGPYQTTINQIVGETVGVVRDKEFALGIQALNINTIEGIPESGDNAGGGMFIDPLPGQQLPESLRDQIGKRVSIDVNKDGDLPEYVRMYRGSMAVKKPHGSELRLFSRNRNIPRIIGADASIQYVPAIDSDFLGSAIALFGCPEPEVLNVIEAIELGEGLPHPMIDGVWTKRSRRPSEAYMLYEGSNMDHCLNYAKQANFRLVHIGDIFESWGHFGLRTKRFPNGAGDIKKFTAKAKDAGISIGIHTLTTFTGVNDAYVSPVPNDSLAKTGSSILLKDLGEDDRELFIKDPLWFNNMGTTHTIKIGDELIAYKSVSKEEPWRLEGLVRGQFKTVKAKHKVGDKVDKLANNSYNGFLPDIYLQQKYAKRLAEVCNETGIDLMDFDGFEGLEATGHGTYGENKFISEWYKTLDRDRLVCGSNTAHYFWHIYSFMNWGEPWYSGLRESQINYRIENQRYFQRNYMPGMLGWFKIDPSYRPEEIEWIQARSAAFDAGYLLRIDESIEKSGFKNHFFEAIREWQKARNSRAFSSAQIEMFKDPKKEFHLKKLTDSSWELYPVRLSMGNEHKFREVQTGEPVASHFNIENSFGAQPVQFYIEANTIEGNKTATITNLKLEINKFQVIEIDESIKAGDKLMCDGQVLYLCDATWNKLKEIKIGSMPHWDEGKNEVVITSDFSGEQSPVLKFDFKTIGKPEAVKSIIDQ